MRPVLSHVHLIILCLLLLQLSRLFLQVIIVLKREGIFCQRVKTALSDLEQLPGFSPQVHCGKVVYAVGNIAVFESVQTSLHSIESTQARLHSFGRSLYFGGVWL